MLRRIFNKLLFGTPLLMGTNLITPLDNNFDSVKLDSFSNHIFNGPTETKLVITKGKTIYTYLGYNVGYSINLDTIPYHKDLSPSSDLTNINTELYSNGKKFKLSQVEIEC